MATPALVVDEKVVVSGRVPTAAGIRDLLSRHLRVARHDGV
jgi:hypothetical protein